MACRESEITRQVKSSQVAHRTSKKTLALRFFQEEATHSAATPLSTLLLLLLLASARAMTTVRPHRFIWFCRNDMRLHDNPCLARIAAHKGEKEVLPVYLFDPRMFATSRRGSPKTGSFRAKFMLESVADLRDQLRSVGSDLLVGVGRPEDVLPPRFELARHEPVISNRADRKHGARQYAAGLLRGHVRLDKVEV